MCGNSPHKRGGKFQFGFAVKKDVCGLLRAFEVSPFGQHGAAELRKEVARRGAKIVVELKDDCSEFAQDWRG